jgi:hypothetical protein
VHKFSNNSDSSNDWETATCLSYHGSGTYAVAFEGVPSPQEPSGDLETGASIPLQVVLGVLGFFAFVVVVGSVGVIGMCCSRRRQGDSAALRDLEKRFVRPDLNGKVTTASAIEEVNFHCDMQELDDVEDHELRINMDIREEDMKGGFQWTGSEGSTSNSMAEARVRCAQGHELKTYACPDDCVMCDQCQRQGNIGDTWFGCRACNFDLCEGCSRAQNTVAVAVPPTLSAADGMGSRSGGSSRRQGGGYEGRFNRSPWPFSVLPKDASRSSTDETTRIKRDEEGHLDCKGQRCGDAADPFSDELVLPASLPILHLDDPRDLGSVLPFSGGNSPQIAVPVMVMPSLLARGVQQLLNFGNQNGGESHDTNDEVTMVSTTLDEPLDEQLDEEMHRHIQHVSATKGKQASEGCIPCEMEEARVRCILGHEIEPCATPDEHVSCDRCHRQGKTGETWFGCRICNFDLCEGCARAQNTVAGSVPPLSGFQTLYTV